MTYVFPLLLWLFDFNNFSYFVLDKFEWYWELNSYTKQCFEAYVFQSMIVIYKYFMAT